MSSYELDVRLRKACNTRIKEEGQINIYEEFEKVLNEMGLSSKDAGGKITFRGEIDRQFILPFGTPEDARNAVRRVYKALCPKGDLTGVFCQCEWGVRNPPENIRAVFDEWTKIGREQGT